jgi:pyridoxine 5'-phosphate synthase PdxJ
MKGNPMSYLEVNLAPFISLWRKHDTAAINPLNLLSYVDSSFAGGISFTYQSDTPLFSEISTLRKLTNSRINIRVNSAEELYKKVIALKPDVITLQNPDNEYSTINLPSKMNSKIINQARDKNITVVPRIKPDIKQLKQVYKLRCPEAEIATNLLGKTENKSNFYNIMGDLTKCYKTAKKNNLRISFGGNLNKRLILALNRAMTPEFYSMGRYLISLSLIKGIDRVLEDIVDTIEK